MSISLCIIAKDEELFIKGCIESAKSLVDEVIVLDTGSTDKTVEVSKSLGAKVFESIWEKDFSKARNECIKKATGDFILILDCDEYIVSENLENIKEYLNKNKSKNIMGANIQVVNIIEGRETASFEAIRLFRNGEGFFFSGKIHEQILPQILEKYGEKSIVNLPLKVHHVGYEEEVEKIKNKRSRNLEILQSIEKPDGYYTWALGNEYLRANNLREAEKYYEESLKLSKIEYNSYGINLILNYLTVLINLNKREKALLLIEENKKIIPKFLDLYFLEFWINFFKGEYEKALTPLEKYLSSMGDKSYHREKYYENIYPLEKMREEIKNKINSKKV